jgi:hypothetical protein
MGFPDRARLSLPVDVAALAAEVEGLPDSEWQPHFNTQIYTGDWSGVALRSVGGVTTQLYPDPAASDPYADTDVLSGLPALRGLLDRLECEKNAARLLRLGPAARVQEHRDYRLGYADGEVRLHVPITSGPGAEFVLSGSPLEMRLGECWYVDVNRPHSVANEGDSVRVHLVIDCVVNAWLDQLLKEAIGRGSADG